MATKSGSENSLALMSRLRISPPLLCSFQKAQWKGSAPKGLEHGSSQNKITLKMAPCVCLGLHSVLCRRHSCFVSWQQAVVTVSTADSYSCRRSVLPHAPAPRGLPGSLLHVNYPFSNGEAQNLIPLYYLPTSPPCRKTS